MSAAQFSFHAQTGFSFLTSFHDWLKDIICYLFTSYLAIYQQVNEQEQQRR